MGETQAFAVSQPSIACDHRVIFLRSAFYFKSHPFWVDEFRDPLMLDLIQTSI